MSAPSLDSLTPRLQRLVSAIAYKCPANIERDDLMQAALIGAWESLVSSYTQPDDVRQGLAIARARGAILDELRRGDWMTRDQRKKLKRLLAVEEAARAGGTSRMSAASLASRCGISVQELFELRSLDLLLRGGDGSTEHEEQPMAGVADTADGPDVLIEKRQLLARAMAVLRSMPQRTQSIVERVLGGERGADVARSMGVSGPLVSQTIRAAVERIRQDIEPPPPPAPEPVFTADDFKDLVRGDVPRLYVE